MAKKIIILVALLLPAWAQTQIFIEAEPGTSIQLAWDHIIWIDEIDSVAGIVQDSIAAQIDYVILRQDTTTMDVVAIDTLSNNVKNLLVNSAFPSGVFRFGYYGINENAADSEVTWSEEYLIVRRSTLLRLVRKGKKIEVRIVSN